MAAGQGGMGDVAGQAFQAVEKALHTPMPFTAGGQTISDRLTAAKHSLAGSQLGKSICKATTEECIGPKKKHLDYLLHCTHEPNVSIPQMANLLIERTQTGQWCVVFKSLVTIHNLMCYGNERFTQYLASCNCDLNLGNFLDKQSVNGYEMSAHVRHYGKYISEKIYTYRLCAFDFCKVKRGREDGLMRTMPPEKLLKTLPILQGQVDSLLEFSVTPSELTNGIINSAFILLFRDLIRLFACYNDGIINLLGVLAGDMGKSRDGIAEKYFDMNKKNCKDALDMYKKFLQRMENVAEFLKVAEAVGIDKGEIPDLAKAPNSLLEALEAHLAGLEGRVYSPTAPAAPSAVGGGGSSYETSRYLREEEERMSRMKAQHQATRPPVPPAPHSSATSHSAASTNPFAAGDLLGLSAPGPPAQQRSTPIDDILALNAQSGGGPQASFNPFATSAAPPAAAPNPFAQGGGGGGFNPFPTAASPYAAQPISDDPFTVNLPKAMPPPRPTAGPGRPPPPKSPSPAPPAAAPAASFNPFLQDDASGAGGGGWNPIAQPAPPSAFAPLSSGLPEPPPDSDSSHDNTPALNPFASADNAPAPFAATGSAAVPIPTAGNGTNPFGGVPADPNNLAIYNTTPFSALDSSYTASPQLPRHMEDSGAAEPAAEEGLEAFPSFGGQAALQPRPAFAPMQPQMQTRPGPAQQMQQQQMAQQQQAMMGQPRPAQGFQTNFPAFPQTSAAAPFAANTGGLPRPAGEKRDLDGTLASLTANLNLQGGGAQAKPVQWQAGNASQPLASQGGAGWSPDFNAAPAAAAATGNPPNDPFGAL